jgi:GntR family transcriptional regulator
MFAFHLDRSGVPPYLQLVQQVKAALLVGYLQPGDRLPLIREVVASLAINPNTVSKAYRQLELENLVVARPGFGTFVVSTPRSTISPAKYSTLRRGLDRWLRSAYDVGLNEETINALFTTAHHELRTEGVA